jgi:oligogalacturonide lyase
MKPYEVYPAERKSFQDRKSGVTVWQLTNYKGHSEHPYFTDDGWFDHDRKMLFVSDRDNVRNLFYIDIESGEIFRITDMPRGGPEIRCPMFVNHELNETYYQYNVPAVYDVWGG